MNISNLTIKDQNYEIKDAAARADITSLDGRVTNLESHLNGDEFIANDTMTQAEIQAGINDNNIIRFMPGNYSVAILDNGHGYVIPSNKTIKAAGATFALEANNRANYEMFLILEADTVTFDGGVIIGDRQIHTGSTGEWGHCIDVVHSNNVILKNLDVSYAWGDGISLDSGLDPGTGLPFGICSNVKIDNCRLHHNSRNNLTIEACDGFVITNCEMDHANRTSPEAGIDIEPLDNGLDVANGLIKDCYIHDNGGTYGCGLHTPIACNVVFDGIRENDGFGFICDGSSDSIIVNRNTLVEAPQRLAQISNGSGCSLTFQGKLVIGDSNASVVMFVSPCSNAHVDFDVDYGGTGKIIYVGRAYGAGPFSQNSLKARIHAPVEPVDYTPETYAQYVYDADIKFDGQTEITTGPTRFSYWGGDYVVNTTGDIAITSEAATIQPGTELHIKKIGAGTIVGLNITNNHYAIVRAVEYGRYVKISDVSL